MNAGVLGHAAELARLAGSSPARSLHRLTELAAQTFPGCSGATATVWRGGELLLAAASHPDLAALLDGQLERGTGQLMEAVRSGMPAGCPDTLTAREWPEDVTDALLVGVRCSHTLVHQRGVLTVTLTMYGTRPRALDPAGRPAASLLAAVGAAMLANAVHNDEARGTVWHLQETVDSQSVVEQAKGILMHALACDAQEAVVRLRKMSQRRNVEVSEMARQLIDEQRGPT